MFVKALCLLIAIALCHAGLAASEPVTTHQEASKVTSEELATWIDQRFTGVWRASNIAPPKVVDDATFMKRAFLDLTGSIPAVSEARDFLEHANEHGRGELVDRLLKDPRRPEKYSERTAAHWATVWRRMMVPGNSPEAQFAIGLEPWLKEQFAANLPYDKFVRALVTVQDDGQAMMAVNPRLMKREGGPALYFLAIGGKPESAASSVSRVFLGVRIGCAECHDHPFAAWKQKDFRGMAAFFSGMRQQEVDDSPNAKAPSKNGASEFVPVFLDGEKANLTNGKSSREALADWMVSENNRMFAPTLVNRVWQQLIGRGLTDSVDDLDKASPAERRVLDELASLFIRSGFDMHWLIAGICKSQLYQRECAALDETDSVPPPGLRPIKTLSPEQIFNSLEQALSLPVARADGSARYNGLRGQLISRMNEAASTSPDEYRAGIPQTLLMMNGRLTVDATDLEQSRTLRGVVDAPFLNMEDKLTTLYLATFSRPPGSHEKQFLLEHLRKQTDSNQQQMAYAEIFWCLLNSPEFVLEK